MTWRWCPRRSRRSRDDVAIVPNPSTVGQTVTVTPTLPADATGTVTLTEGDTLLDGPVSLTSDALQFDGHGGVTLPAIGGVNSISFWFQAEDNRQAGGDGQAPLVYSGTDDYNSNDWDWGVWSTTSGSVGCSFYAASHGYAEGQASYASGTWNHVVVVRNDNGVSRFYLNGVQQADAEDSVDTVPGNVVHIGSAGGYDLQGQIDELLLYDRPLTVADVQRLYANGAGCEESANAEGLLAGYHFDEGSRADGPRLHEQRERRRHKRDWRDLGLALPRRNGPHRFQPRSGHPHPDRILQRR